MKEVQGKDDNGFTGLRTDRMVGLSTQSMEEADREDLGRGNVIGLF